jgi:hypothetical protein
MPHYFFDLIDGVIRRDRTGMDCLDESDAINKAGTIADEVSAAHGHNHRSDLHISIRNKDGHEIGNVPVPFPSPQH